MPQQSNGFIKTIAMLSQICTYVKDIAKNPPK